MTREESTEERTAGCTLQPILVLFFFLSSCGCFCFLWRNRGKRGTDSSLFNGLLLDEFNISVKCFEAVVEIFRGFKESPCFHK